MAAEERSSITKWWEDYAKNPLEALDHLLCRRVFMGNLDRNETEEILFRLFHNQSIDTLRQLDLLMKDWYAGHWGRVPTGMELSRWVEILQNSFIAVYRLALPGTALYLRDSYAREKAWIRSLYRGPARDAEGDLLRTLALLQKDRMLQPTWIGLCRMEEDLPLHYTSIGILGLRKLPEKDGTPPRDLPASLFKGITVLAEALEKHKQEQGMEHWVREVRVIAALYPRSREYWALNFYPLIQHPPGSRPRQWLDKAIPKLSERVKPPKAGFVQPPPRERRDYFLHQIGKYPLEKFKGELKLFLSEHRRYANLTGDAFFLERTFSNIGYRVYRQDPDFALALVEEAFSWEPHNPFLWSHRAIIEDYRGNTKQATAILWEAKRRFPENPVIRNKLAHLMEKQGKNAIAEALYRQTMADFPKDVVCRAGLAEVLKALGRLPEAEEIYRQAMADFPGNDVCRNGLADVLKAQDRLEEAEEVYRQAMADFPGNDVCRNGLAEVLKAQGRLDEAEKVYRQTMKEFPKDVVCRAGLAEVLKALGQLDEAEEIYRQAMVDFPDNVVCRAGLAEVLKALGQLDEAEDIYRQTVADFPKDVVCRAGLAVVLLKKNQDKKAISLLKETLKIFPGNKVAGYLLKKVQSGEEITAEDEKNLEQYPRQEQEKLFPSVNEPGDEFVPEPPLPVWEVGIPHEPLEKTPISLPVQAKEILPGPVEKVGSWPEKAAPADPPLPQQDPGKPPAGSTAKAVPKDKSQALLREPPAEKLMVENESDEIPAYIKPTGDEIEIEIGEITTEQRESRKAPHGEKEKFRQRISARLMELQEKAPANLAVQLAQAVWLSDNEPEAATEFLARQTAAHPGTLGFRVLQLRTAKGNGNGNGKNNTPWQELIHDFPARSTIIKLEHTLYLLDHRKETNGQFLTELENLRRRLTKDTGRLPLSLQKREEWVEQTLERSLFDRLGPDQPLDHDRLTTITENLYSNDNEKQVLLRETVNQYLFADV